MMISDGPWVALLAVGGAEYDAQLELQRLGLHPYLPQFKKKWTPYGVAKPLARRYALFPGYVLLPLAEARAREVYCVRQLRQPKPILCDGDGRLWTVPAAEVHVLAKAENEGGFDEVAPSLGDKVRLRAGGALSAMELLVSSVDDKTARLFSPLFGGCRGRARPADLARAG
jgi:hypothetical protein